jgi:hypothetical protein
MWVHGPPSILFVAFVLPPTPPPTSSLQLVSNPHPFRPVVCLRQQVKLRVEMQNIVGGFNVDLINQVLSESRSQGVMGYSIPFTA